MLINDIDVPGSDNKNMEIISLLRTYTDVRFVHVFSLFQVKNDRYLFNNQGIFLN